MEPMHQVFIRYSNLDTVVANRICEQLESRSVKCWIAPRDIQPGSSWAGSIMKAIKSSKVLLLLLTKDSNESEQVIREVERAVKLRLRIICLRLDDIDLSDDLEYFISAVHGVDAYGKPLEKVLTDLHKTLKPLLPASSASTAPTIQTVAEAKPQQHSAKQLEEAYKAYQNKNYHKALVLYLPLAEQGNATAQYNLGRMYAKGEGVSQDKGQAVLWYRKAAEKGYAAAQNSLGWMYDNGEGVGQDKGQAVQWYQKAAEQGYAAAQNNLGVMYDNGEGVGQDKGQAVLWYRKAVEQGYAAAQYNLGLMYEKGEGVNQDTGQAVQWHRKAAEQGYAEANKRLEYLSKKP